MLGLLSDCPLQRSLCNCNKDIIIIIIIIVCTIIIIVIIINFILQLAQCLHQTQTSQTATPGSIDLRG